MESNNIRGKIFEEVLSYGYNINHHGTRYIVEAIEMIYNSDDEDFLISSIEKNVYYKIAEKYNRNPLTIKSNITKATNYADDLILIKNRKNKEKYYYREKLTAKAVISQVLLKLAA